jgi:SpoIID/LytB domain protein
MEVRPGIHESARAIVALLFAVFVAAVAPFNSAQAGDLGTVPSADAWVNRSQPDRNYGSAPSLRAASGASESVMRFKLDAWAGQNVSAVTLTLHGVSGDATALSVDEASNSWKESTVNWRTRPSSVRTLDTTPAVAGASATFDLTDLFVDGVVDRTVVSLRVRSTTTDLTTFGARESTSPARLNVVVRPQVQSDQLEPIGDTWADATNPTATHGTAKWLFADAKPRIESYVAFDVSAWKGMEYDSLQLRLEVRTAGAGGVSVYRVGTKWSESNLNWDNRPTAGTLLTQVSSDIATGQLVVDVRAAFAGQKVDAGKLGLRVVASSSDGIDFSSREGSVPPVLDITGIPQVSPSPTASPTATPTASPTATPTAPPTATPTASPTATPTATPAPTPEPLFYFDGRGTDHGVGMSQQGARGRASAGQTYDEILKFYYTGVDLTTIDGATPVRVLLSDAFTPSVEQPARVTAYIGGWQSAAFPGLTFPQGSYVEMWPPSPTPSPSPTPAPSASPPATPSPTPSSSPSPSPSPSPTASPAPQSWVATVYDSVGTVLASAPTDDLVVEALDPDGVLQMTYRDEMPKYKLYRGEMRVLVTPTGLQTINILPLESYLRGVVPAEVPATWPLEAVKTQAVAARTYAWSRLKGDAREWDVVPTAANQVYGGYQHEHPNSDRAVLQTQNIVVTYKGKVISALYHACAGGYTENSEYAFVNDKGDPGSVVAYLRGKPDVDANGVPYDINAGSYSWKSGQFTMSQLSQIMAGNELTNVGQIYVMTFYRGVSGRVYKVVLEGSEGTLEVSGGKFKNTYNNNRVPGSPNMVSTLFYLTPVAP